jgi:hypothetical protein
VEEEGEGLGGAFLFGNRSSSMALFGDSELVLHVYIAVHGLGQGSRALGGNHSQLTHGRAFNIKTRRASFAVLNRSTLGGLRRRRRRRMRTTAPQKRFIVTVIRWVSDFLLKLFPQEFVKDLQVFRVSHVTIWFCTVWAISSRSRIKTCHNIIDRERIALDAYNTGLRGKGAE